MLLRSTKPQLLPLGEQRHTNTQSHAFDLVRASWTGLCPEFVALARAGKLQAWNLPLGVLSHLVRDCGAGRPGTLTRIGLATFVDPRERGGKVSGPHQADVVQARALLPQSAEQVQSLFLNPMPLSVA